MDVPPQLARLIEQAKHTAVDGIALAFNKATRHVFEREAASGIRSSHGQARAALACLREAESRLAIFTEATKRILLAAHYAPTVPDQVALLDIFGATMEVLLVQVNRRTDAAAGQSVMDRNAVTRTLGSEVGKVRGKCRHEFELMLVECAHANVPVAPNVSVVYNLIGDNTRINHGGVDASTNLINVSAIDLFSNLRRAIESGIADPVVRQRLLDTASALQAQTEPASRSAAYLSFVCHAASHMSVVAPFLPALAKWAQ